jgi:uncharacterized surface protein with fasciclin (FAS1) repeats
MVLDFLFLIKYKFDTQKNNNSRMSGFIAIAGSADNSLEIQTTSSVPSRKEDWGDWYEPVESIEPVSAAIAQQNVENRNLLSAKAEATPTVKTVIPISELNASQVAILTIAMGHFLGDTSMVESAIENLHGHSDIVTETSIKDALLSASAAFSNPEMQNFAGLLDFGKNMRTVVESNPKLDGMKQVLSLEANRPLLAALATSKNIVLFAPSNLVLAPVLKSPPPADALSAILSRHYAVNVKKYGDKIKKNESRPITTASGVVFSIKRLADDRKGIFDVNGKQVAVVEASVRSRNGIIYVINAILPDAKKEINASIYSAPDARSQAAFSDDEEDEKPARKEIKPIGLQFKLGENYSGSPSATKKKLSPEELLKKFQEN